METLDVCQCLLQQRLLRLVALNRYIAADLLLENRNQLLLIFRVGDGQVRKILCSFNYTNGLRLAGSLGLDL